MVTNIKLGCSGCNKTHKYNVTTNPQIAWNKDTHELYYSKTGDKYKCDCGSSKVSLKFT